MMNDNKCIICKNIANAKGSHIVPANLIKDCIGIRDNEVSYNVNLINGSKKIFIGKDLSHKSEEINSKKLKTTDTNPYILDYIFCDSCERELGKVEGKVYTEIICKVRDVKYKNNFQTTVINKLDVLISKKITVNELNIYFYSIILRVIYYFELKGIAINIEKNTIHLISFFLNNLVYNLSSEIVELKTGLIVYITNIPKLNPTFLKTNKFEKLIIPCCNFIIILEEHNIITPFGNCINLTTDKEFKLIKNSILLDDNLSIFKNL